MGSVEGTVRGTVHESAHHVVGWGQATGPRPHRRLSFPSPGSEGRKLWHARPSLSNPPQHHRPGPWPWGGSLYYMVPNIEGVTCVFNFESPCWSNDACAFIVFNFWCLSLPFCIVWAKCVQWMRMCSYDCAKCVLASAKVFSVSVNVFRVLQHVF